MRSLNMEKREFIYSQNHNRSEKPLIYYVSGSGKKSIVIMHGYNFNSQTWEEVGLVGALNRAGYRTFLIDMPNFPKSVNKVWVTPETFADMLDKFVDTTVMGKPAMLGSSASGFYIGKYLERHSNKVDKLILVAPVNLDETDLKKVENEILVILGTNDPALNHVKHGVAQLKNARTVMMDGGHAPYLDHPKEFAAIVVGFLNGK